MKILIEGIYYSRKTGKIFETTLKGNKVLIKYVDGTAGFVIDKRIFMIQGLYLDYYDQLADY